MRESVRNLVVGTTALVGLVGLLYLLVMFGSFTQWTRSGYEVAITLSQAGGLSQGSQVRLNGIAIGTVRTIELLDQPTDGAYIRIVCFIDQDRRIPADVTAYVKEPLIGGSPSLAFDMTGLSAAQITQLLPTDGSATLHAQSSDIAGQFATALQGTLDEPVRLLGEAIESFKRLSAEWEEVGVNVNQLIEQRSVEDVDGGQSTGNLTTVLARLDQRLVEFRAVLSGVDRWVNDEQMHADVRSAVSSASSAAAKFDATMDDVDQTVKETRTLVTDARGQVDQLIRRYVAVADDASAALGSIKQAVELARAGEGTVGKLLNDPSLYNNLNDTAERLNVAVDELRLLLEKIQKEGLPVQF